MHEEIFTLCFHGRGGFTWEEVYNIPVWLRRFYLNKLVEAVKKENDEYERSSGGSGGSSTPSMPRMPSGMPSVSRPSMPSMRR